MNKPTSTGLWRVTIQEPRKAAYQLPTLYAGANHEAAVEMADQTWSDRTPLPPVVKVELVGEVYVRCG